MPKSDILDIITPDQALIVLKELVVQDPKIKKKAREIAFCENILPEKKFCN